MVMRPEVRYKVSLLRVLISLPTEPHGDEA